GLEKATIPEVDSVRSGILAHAAENVAERPGAVDTGRDLLNIAGAPGGFPGRPGAAGPPDMNDIRITAGKITTRLRSGCLARKAAGSRAASMATNLLDERRSSSKVLFIP